MGMNLGGEFMKYEGISLTPPSKKGVKFITS
ncbi:Uncharacterised protein [Yersinia pseudotuberculosis]|uniref:Uncharacterized protein n=1 Tax=Yersinia pseudotuberculosis TaxID=633 RepID=A0A380Q5H1_YERPU|nr:Uncharacterised protein [Yersinia pseudotuberculosis]SUP80792.1 Uncharacterised protein [Yersinia pseudotuberculosis]